MATLDTKSSRRCRKGLDVRRLAERCCLYLTRTAFPRAKVSLFLLGICDGFDIGYPIIIYSALRGEDGNRHTHKPSCPLETRPFILFKGKSNREKKSLTCAQTCYYRKSRASSHSVPSFFRSQMTSTPWFFFGGKWQSPFSSPNRKMKRNRERGLFLIYALSLGKQTLSGWITIIAHMCVRLHFVSLFFSWL